MAEFMYIERLGYTPTDNELNYQAGPYYISFNPYENIINIKTNKT